MWDPRRAQRPHVIIAGGGFAALEAAVALRALAADRVRLTFVSPDPYFRYRPAATLESFREGRPLLYNLRELVKGLRGRLEMSRLVAVSPQAKTVELESGRHLSYDRLILALGAETRPAIPGALTFRDQRDAQRVHRLIEQARAGTLTKIVFVVPSPNSWSLPAYELALLAASALADGPPDAQLTVVTPEKAPLEVFGAGASERVAGLLAAHEIGFLGGVTPRAARGGLLELEFEAPVRADAVIAVPELKGRRMPGVPANWHGFIPADSFGRVEGLTDVYAAGDATAFPIKQGGLAAQQADRIAHTIAAGLGAPVHELHSARILQAHLEGGPNPLFLRTELDEFGQPSEPALERATSAGADAAKVYARYLGPYLAQHNLFKEVKAA